MVGYGLFFYQIETHREPGDATRVELERFCVTNIGRGQGGVEGGIFLCLIGSTESMM